MEGERTTPDQQRFAGDREESVNLRCVVSVLVLSAGELLPGVRQSERLYKLD